MKILAIVGSPRPNGNTNYLVDQALQEAKALGAETEKVILSELKLNPCFGHQNCRSLESCQQKDDGMALLEKFCEADGIILASPVYYYDVTAWMKIFIDRNYFLFSHGKKSKARAVGMIVVAGGAGIEDAVRTLKKLASGSTANVAKENRFLVTGFGDVKNNTTLVNEARQLGKQMVNGLK
jgi:multimeric flavodoxin WrbA